MSSLSWIAYSDAERRKTLDVISQLQEQGTVDQLGLGRIRDSFAESLFPGTSTIQTRARYFLLIPWFYQRLEARSPVRNAADRARGLEIDLIGALVRGSGDEESLGIIGKNARETLVQLPSSNYWQGLRMWGIRLYPRDRAAYHRLLGRADVRRTDLDDDGNPLPGSPAPSWDPSLPEPPEDLLESASIDLTPEEADYLADRIAVNIGESALADLVAGSRDLPAVPFPWTADATRSALSDQNQELLHQAELFSLVMHGASLLYNRMLAELTERTADERRHTESYDVWGAEVEERHGDASEWLAGIERFWELAARGNPRVPSLRERRFVEAWSTLALSMSARLLAQAREARDLIVARERETKGANARFVNRTALEAWGGSSGAARLDYRWGLVQRLISDIRTALPA